MNQDNIIMWAPLVIITTWVILLIYQIITG